MKIKITLFLIIAVAIFLRFFQLGVNPPLLNWDETAWGYNAYAVGIDGRDEFGKFLPHDYIESFGDYKPPVYLYADVLPIKVFGLNQFATRFPSAFFGVLTVLVTYFLVQRIFYNSKNKHWYALAAAGVLAISPWHIMLSRAAFEANVATFFIVIGVWLFLAAMQERKWFLIVSAVSFVLSVYTFNSARVVSPLLVIFLSLIFWKTLWKNKKQTIIAAVVGVVLLLPTLTFLFSPQAKVRFEEVNIFSDVSLVKTSNQEIANDNNNPVSKIIHNRRVVYSLAFLKHYFDNLDPHFLFISGDGNPKFSIQEVGEMYLWDIPFFIIGIFILFKKKEGYWWIIPLWLLLGIIPAATARETPHALRTEATLPMFQVFVGLGFVATWLFIKEKVSQKNLQKLFMGAILLMLAINVFYFQFLYYSQYKREFSGDWNYSYKAAIAYVSSAKNQYKHIYITEDLGRPYIYFLFYTHTSPQEFRKTALVKRDVFGFVDVQGFDGYTFMQDMNMAPKEKGSLYLNTFDHVPANAHVLQRFNLLNGDPSLVAYTL